MPQRECELMRMTAPTAGAVAVLQLHGGDAVAVASAVCGRATDRWPMRRLMLVRFGDFDEGLAVRLDERTVQLMPHGGPRVVQCLVDRLCDAGATVAGEPQARRLFPEAASAIEADMLMALAGAMSPAAIDLLATQPERWREAWRSGELLAMDRKSRQCLGDRATVWARLLRPATVVVVGRPNVGKSTLANALMGRSASLVADLPGTTRDWVGGLVELNGQVAVHWLDTPGLRTSDDTVEQRAIELARQVIAQADVLVAMRDPDTDWPDLDALPKRPKLWVLNKADRLGEASDTAEMLAISAEHGDGLETLQHAVIAALGLADVSSGSSPQLWPFSPTLRRWCEDGGGLENYVVEDG